MPDDDVRLADPLFAAGFSAGVLQSADLGTQVLVAQLQATMDQQQRLLDVMQETLTRLEQVAALFREVEAGAPYWRSHA
jgi:hypothetical protein